jgi:hypothetical protein
MSEARLQQNIQTIQNNPSIPEAQKEMAVKQMRSAYDMQHKMADAARAGQGLGQPHP